MKSRGHEWPTDHARLPVGLVGFLLAVLVLAPSHLALGQGLTRVCAEDGTAAPPFRHDRTGALSPIRDPRLRAIAERVCNLRLEDTPARVDLTNRRDTAIFVGCTLATGAPGSITWGEGCTPTGGGAQQATVPTTAGSSRFCAALDQPPADGDEAQAHHQTMVETTFQAASNRGCFNQGRCVWYDLSVIPQDGTHALWRQDRCANTGGASYHLPVALACGGAGTFTCQGPTDAR